MDAVERGETIVVTRNGTPVAKLCPLRRRTFVPTVELKRAFALMPPIDYTAMRAEMDALLGVVGHVRRQMSRILGPERHIGRRMSRTRRS